MALSSLERIKRLRILGAKIKQNVAEAVTELSLDFSTDMVTELGLTVSDPGFKITKTRIFEEGTTLDFGELRFTMISVELMPGPSKMGAVRVRCHPTAAYRLRTLTGSNVMRDVSPTAYLAEECKTVGLAFVGQPSQKRNKVERDVHEIGEPISEEQTIDEQPSAWTTAQRLAKELGYIVFESGGTLYFGKPSWIVNKIETVRVGWLGVPERIQMLGPPTAKRTIMRASRRAEITFTVPWDRANDFRPGYAVQMEGVPMFKGTYICTRVRLDAGRGRPVQVTCATPIDPVPTGEAGSGGDETYSGRGEYAFIVDAAVAAGFTGRSLTIAVAVALAESGGRRRATNHNSNGSTDYGLWQINSVHTANGFEPGKAFDPEYNARWAWKVSSAGTDWSPWVAYTSGAYEEHMDEARRAIRVDRTGGEGGGQQIENIIDTIRSQIGDPYEFGAVADPDDPNPHGFDCAEIIAWACARNGVDPLPTAYSIAMHDEIVRRGRHLSAAEAKTMRGALLFGMPGKGSWSSNIGHVEMSLGNGKSIGAASSTGVSIQDADRINWTCGGMLRGVAYGRDDATADSDGDGLPDWVERPAEPAYPTNPVPTRGNNVPV